MGDAETAGHIATLIGDVSHMNTKREIIIAATEEDEVF
jgi:hypothetical protein